MKRGFLGLLDPSNDPEFFWQVISGPPVCSVLKNADRCIESICYATNLYSTHPWLLNFEIMLKIVPINGISLSG
jgi:hypothetical protein